MYHEHNQLNLGITMRDLRRHLIEDHKEKKNAHLTNEFTLLNDMHKHEHIVEMNNKAPDYMELK